MGFNITTEDGKPIILFAYETRAEAEAAATHATGVVDKAVSVQCAKCGAPGRHIDVRPNWKEQPPRESLTGKVWR